MFSNEFQANLILSSHKSNEALDALFAPPVFG